MTAWQIALGQLNAGAYVHKRNCEYCGAEFVVPKRHSEKRFCDGKCGRQARYLREHGRKAHSPRVASEPAVQTDECCGCRWVSKEEV